MWRFEVPLVFIASFVPLCSAQACACIGENGESKMPDWNVFVKEGTPEIASVDVLGTLQARYLKAK